MKKIILLCIGIMLLISLSVPTVSAKVDFEMVAQYGTPTVDGEVTDGEYSADSTYVMNAETASAWVGQVGEPCVTVRFAWDEVGLYYAATINDTTPSYRGEDGHWVGIDCLELAVNPAHAIPANDKIEGIFFSFGATRRGDVVGWRHNYLDGLVSEEIMGAAQGHKKGSDGYTIEVCIPWELVLMDTDCTIGGKTDLHIDTTAFVPENGAVLGVLPCAIDADENEKILAAYKFNGTDFLVRDFINLTLTGKADATTEQEMTETSEIESVTDAVTPSPEPEAQPGGCGAWIGGTGLGAVIVFALAAAWVLGSKK